jgi:hypothetical protein
MKQIGYKIRNKETGQFSKGGTWSVWTKQNGKTWNNIGALKNHLNQFLWNGELRHDYPYHNAEIVEVEIDLDDCFTYEVDELVSKMQESKKKQEEDYKAKQEKWVRERELKLLAELEKKYKK